MLLYHTHYYVLVDVAKAGIGKLVVIISVDGVNVPNTVYQDGPTQYRFTFKPNIAKPHEVMVSCYRYKVSLTSRYRGKFSMSIDRVLLLRY